MKRRVAVSLPPHGPLRAIVALDQHGTLGRLLHQAATAGLRQPALSGAASAQLVAERAEQARIAEQIRAARRAREVAELSDMRSFAES